MKRLLLAFSLVSGLAAGTNLQFEKNAGQAAADVDFLMRPPGGKVLLRPSGVEFRGGGAESIEWEWLGATKSGRWRGVSSTGNSVSYFLGNDRSRWVDKAPAYSRIQRDGLYPDVHWTAYVHDGQLEYDLVLDPGADPSHVLLQVRGARAALRSDGSVEARSEGVSATQRPPRLYQLIDGRRQSVPGRFVARGEGLFGLDIAAYRRDLPLVVDPVIDAVFSFSGPGDERVVADCGEYSVGVTRSAAWNRPAGSGNTDVFIRRQTGTGSNTIFWGGDGDDEATSCSGGYIAGWTTSQNVPLFANTRGQTRYGGGESDGFLLTMQPNGPSYATYVGGTGKDRVNAVLAILDRDVLIGHVFAGETDSDSWNDVVVDHRGRGSVDAFVGSVRNDRPTLLILGGGREDRATALAIIDNTTFAVSGSTESEDFPLVDALQPQRNGPSDAWLTQIAWPTGELPRVTQSTLWGGLGSERTASLWNVPGVGLYLAGTTTSSDLPVTGGSRYGGGASDGFVTRFTLDGKRVAASSFLGGSGADEVLCATLRGSDLVVGGVTSSTDFPIRGGVLQERHGGGKDGFAAHLDTSGQPVWSTFWGGEADDAVLSMSAQGNGALRLAGWTQSRSWLQTLRAAESLASPQAAEPPSGTEGFLADIRYSLASAPDQLIGKDLQAALPLAVTSEPGADGILVVRSADPARLLVALSPEVVGTEQVTVFDADVRPPGSVKAVYLQALEAGVETEVILSGRHYPEHRVKVRLLPSALFVSETDATVNALAGQGATYSSTVFAAAVDETGKALARQSVRAGVDPAFQLRSSDESGLKPEYSSASQYSRAVAGQTFNFQPIREGVYTLTPSSPAFPVAAGQQVTVRVDTRNWPVTRLYLARGTRARVPLSSNLSGRLHVVSEDPSRLLLSLYATTAEQAQIDYPPPLPSFSGIFVSALGDSGEAVVRIEGPDGKQARVIVAMAPLEVSISPAAARIPVTGIAYVALQARPAGKPPAGFQVPEQWLWPPKFSASISDSSVLRTVGYDVPQGNWVMRFEGLQPGTATVNFDWPEHAATRPQFQVQVAPGSIQFDGAEVILPEGGIRDFDPSTFLGGQAVQNVSLAIRDASIATFGIGQTTIKANPQHGLQMHGLGKAGEETVLTVSAPGMPEMKVPVRIVPKILLPVENEKRVNGSGTIWFRIAVIHPGSGAPVSGYFRSLQFGPIPVRVEADPPGICDFANQIDTYLNVTCSGSGETIVRVQPLSGFGATPDFGRIRIIANDPRTRILNTSYGTQVPARALVGNRLQTTVETPYGMTGPITLTSLDPAKVRLSAAVEGPAVDRITVERPQTAFLHGFASEGSATVSAEAANAGRSDITVHFFPSVIALTAGSAGESGLGEVRRPLSVSPLQLFARPGLLDPASGAVYTSDLIRIAAGIEPFLLTLRSSDPDVAEPQRPTPLFTEGNTYQPASFRLGRAGVADLSVAPPDGFVAAPGATMRLRVYEPALGFSERIVLDKDLMQRVTVIQEGNRGTYLNGEVTVTSLDPDKVLVSASGAISGQTSITVPGAASVYLQALTGGGPARLRLQAAGYQDSIVTIEFLPAALALDTPFLDFSPGQPGSVRLLYAPMERDRLISGWTGGFRPGAELRVRYRSSNPGIIDVSGAGEAVFAPGMPTVELPLRSIRPGSAEIIVEAPPDKRTIVERIPVRVRLWQFSAQSSVLIGRFLTTPIEVTSPRADSVNARASLTSGATLLLSFDKMRIGEASVALPMGGNARATLYLQPVGAGNRSEVTLSAPDFEDFRLRVDVADPEFVFRPSGGSNLNLSLAAGSVTVPVLLTAAGSYLYNGQPLGPFRGPVRVQLKSSNPAVVKPAVEWLDFQPGDSSRNLTMQLVGRGDAVLTLQAPDGFNVPTGKHEILITVR